MNKFVLGVEVAGSHVTVQLVDLSKKQVVDGSWLRNRLDTNGSADAIIDAWATTIEDVISGVSISPAKISIAMPGPMDYKKGISEINGQGKYQALYQKNIKELLASRLGFEIKKIHLINDAACFLQGELYTGVISEFDEAIGLTLGTGLGTAHTTKGKATDSKLWKMPFLKGIAEDYISTRWFIKRFAELSGEQIKDVKDLIDNYQQSPFFKPVFDEFSRNLASFIHVFVRKKMPHAAVLGGNISNAEAFFLDDTRKYLAEIMGYSFPVRKSSLGETATILGAAASF